MNHSEYCVNVEQLVDYGVRKCDRDETLSEEPVIFEGTI